MRPHQGESKGGLISSELFIIYFVNLSNLRIKFIVRIFGELLKGLLVLLCRCISFIYSREKIAGVKVNHRTSKSTVAIKVNHRKSNSKSRQKVKVNIEVKVNRIQSQSHSHSQINKSGGYLNYLIILRN